jgi:pyruvate,water dikinase
VSVVALKEAMNPGTYGGKAVQLGTAMRAGLPVPDGFALSCDTVEAVVSGHSDVLVPLEGACTQDRPHAVRSSAVGEDSQAASFAGTHLTVLGACGVQAVAEAVRGVHASGLDAGAGAYRTRLGLDEMILMAVVVQELIDADAAGVLFTRNPVTGAAELIIEASWGLGEAVVSGLVTPDHYILGHTGELRGLVLGEKDLAIRWTGQGTSEVAVPEHLIGEPCLGATELAALHDLVSACDTVYGSTEHDIEFAFSAGMVFLLQRRPITRA